jgi:peptidoglycan hydrolase CwlO-like protein
MTIDEVILAHRLKDLQREALELDVYIANRRADIEKESANLDKQQVKLDRLMERISSDKQALFWVRMDELLHTPCWRYRVAS